MSDKKGISMRIKVLGQQFDSENNKIDEIQLITDATIKNENGLFIIDYTESSENADDNVTTRLRVTEKKLIMTKLSMVSSTLEFEVDEKYHSIYSTIYGDFKMIISTMEYNYNLNEDGVGDIYLKYMVNLGDGEPYSNALQISLYE